MDTMCAKYQRVSQSNKVYLVPEIKIVFAFVASIVVVMNAFEIRQHLIVLCIFC